MLFRTSHLVALAAAFAACSCSSGELVRRTDRSTYDSRAVEAIRLTSSNGRLDVERHGELERLELVVELEVGGATRDEAEERLRATHVRTLLERGELSAWAEFPEPRHGLDAASFLVRAPHPAAVICKSSNGAIRCDGLERSVDAETSNGAVEIRGRHAGVRARSSNGAITVTGCLGKVSATTQNGAIEVELASEARGGFELETSNGSIGVSAPRSIGGRVRLDTSNGDIDVEAKGVLEEAGQRSSTRRELVLSDDGPASVVRTTNGSIRLRLR